MSHLGELLSALVDGELSGAQLDRANAHLATCGACRVEAGSLRRLKHELRALREMSDSGEIADRLLALTGEPGPAAGAAGAPPWRQGRPHGGRGRRRYHAARRRAARDTAAPQRAVPPEKRTRRRRGRYVLWTTVSLVVVGIGTAAFGMGGGTQEPKVTPQLEVFNLQQAISSGDVPFADPAETSTSLPADISARVPAVAARP